MGGAVPAEKPTVKRLGRLPDVGIGPPVSRAPLSFGGDRFVASPEGGKEPVELKKGPRSQAGKIAEKAWVATVGVGAGGVGYFISKTMMSFARDMGPLTLRNLVKGQMVAGVVAGLPFSLVQEAFAYKNGKISAQRYWGNVASGAISFGLWGVGAVAATALIGPGFLGVVGGLALGSILSSVFDKTLGRKISTGIAMVLPAGAAKSGANGVVKYVANPIDKAIVQPVKRNLALFLATGGLAAVYFGIKGGRGVREAKSFLALSTKEQKTALAGVIRANGIPKKALPRFHQVVLADAQTAIKKGHGGRTALKGLAAIGVSTIPQIIGDTTLSAVFPMKPVRGIDLAPREGKEFSPDDGQMIDKDPTNK